jgi:serine/threonine protein phosphatase PrpC
MVIIMESRRNLGCDDIDKRRSEQGQNSSETQPQSARNRCGDKKPIVWSELASPSKVSDSATESQGSRHETEKGEIEMLKKLEIAKSLSNLADLYCTADLYSEAEPRFRRVLAIRQEVLGAKHPDTAASLHELANCCMSQGKYSEAEPLFVQAKDIRQEVLGAKHSDTAASLHELANYCMSQGKYSEAEPLFVQAKDIRQEVLGAKHPDTAASLHDLVVCYCYQGKYSEAIPLLVQATAIHWERQKDQEEINKLATELKAAYEFIIKEKEAFHELRYKINDFQELYQQASSLLEDASKVYKTTNSVDQRTRFDNFKTACQPIFKMHRHLKNFLQANANMEEERVENIRKRIDHPLKQYHDAGPSSSHRHAPQEKIDECVKELEVYVNKKSKEGIINGEDKIRINIEKMVINKKGFIKEIASATTGYHEPNEDSCFISEYSGGVFDGVSKGGRGAEASQMAKESFKQKLSELFGTIKRDRLSSEQIEAELMQITLEINNEINEKLNKNTKIAAKTTLSVVMPIGDGKMMAVNVGDSRVYVLTNDANIKHITTDDGPFGNSKAWNEYQDQHYFSGLIVDKEEQKKIQEKVANINNDEIRKIKEKDCIYSPKEIKIKYAIMKRNKISQLLGGNSVKPNIVTFDINPGDRVIITSDGIHDNLSDKEIIECVSTSKTAEYAAQVLVKTSRANSLDQTCSRCKQDDATAVVIECSGEGGNNV